MIKPPSASTSMYTTIIPAGERQSLARSDRASFSDTCLSLKLPPLLYGMREGAGLTQTMAMRVPQVFISWVQSSRADVRLRTASDPGEIGKPRLLDLGSKQYTDDQYGEGIL